MQLRFKHLLHAGNRDRNRSMDGDSVAVELLPVSQWRRRPTRESTVDDEKHAAAKRNNNDDGDDENDEDDDEDDKVERASNVDVNVVPTGRVVGIFERAWRE
jgi:exoribonuclease R